MKMRILLYIICFLSVSCQFGNGDWVNKQVITPPRKIEIKYAQGFELIYTENYTSLSVNSLSEKYPFYDSVVFCHKLTSEVVKSIPKKFNNIACQSSTHAAFLKSLGCLNKVVAISDFNYMPKDILYEELKAQKIIELNQNNSVDIERLVESKADIFFTYPFEWKSSKYSQLGTPTILVSEYLEETPIARLEWIKFFGYILNEDELADSIFNLSESTYNSLKVSVDTNQTVMFNLPFKEIWDMPSKKSLTANLVKDAGLNYNVENKGRDNIVLDKELAWEKGVISEYWIIIANRPEDYSLEDLISEDDIYSEFISVQKKQVLFCNTSYSSYFTEGVLEPDIMLKDLLFHTGKIEMHTPKYFKVLK